MSDKVLPELDQLSRTDLLDLARKIAALAKEDESGHARVQSAETLGTARDPLVRSLAAIALNDLLKDLSFRQIGSMFNVSHARVHQMANLLGIETEKRKKA